MKNVIILTLGFILLACQQNKKEEKETIEKISTETQTEQIPVEPNGGIGDGATSITDLYIKNIEQAHKKSKFLSHKAVRFDIDITFGGKQRLDGTITMLTDESKIKIEKKDGSTLWYDTTGVYLSPQNANDAGARFDMFTWTYFFKLPYKLNDPGTLLTLEKERIINNTTYTSAKLTFESGIGDSPEDWYIIFTDPQNQVKAASYIVTFGSNGDISKAEADPHLIAYNDMIVVDGIPFATSWDFYGWTEEKGITDALGKTKISNIAFLEDTTSIFDIPKDNKEIKL